MKSRGIIKIKRKFYLPKLQRRISDDFAEMDTSNLSSPQPMPTPAQVDLPPSS